ncbi:hypothetical protein SAY86_021931 [Trapa natans]|uniref:PPM-type phosphatase domain-containing protein n=1 Tax=Trapa natans TaxID=22666 RepID=A0AAN7M9I7_TRANT|nr:hypothetical protein SAY86_021931 [Trapa natans]
MDNLCCCNSLRSQLVGGSSSCSSGKGRSSHGPIKYGFSLIKGKANHPMEDYHVAKFVKVKRHELGLFAIFDGHLGDSVPAYLQKHLFTNILKEEDFWNNPTQSIAIAYEKTDQAILSHKPDLGRGGSTAVTAILIDGCKLWIANIGDSRAVLSRRGQAIQLSVDHEPNTERGSIENRGGFVSNMPDSDTDILILASDGIWKVMSNEEAVDFARKIKDPQRAARSLTTEALTRDSKDDISCIVVRLNS